MIMEALNDDLVWVVKDLDDFQERLELCKIVRYEGQVEELIRGGLVVKMWYVEFQNGLTRGEKKVGKGDT